MAAPQCISGRTSYLHVRLEFLLYPPLIPQFCNTGEFEPRRTFTSASLWSWIAHVVSGRILATTRLPLRGVSLALFRLGFPAAPPLWRGLTWRRRCTRRIILQKARHQPYLAPSRKREWPLTAGEYAVSGSLSSPSRGAFHLSLTVLVHYRSLKMLSLGGWSPQLPTRFLVPCGTQDASPHRPGCGYGALTPYGGAFQHLRLARLSLLLVLQPHHPRRHDGLGSSRFARHYYGNLG